MQNRKQQLKKLLFRITQFTLIAFITLVMLEMVLGIVFRIKDRNLIKAETLDYPYFYFKLSPEKGVRNADGFKTNYTRKKPEGVTRIAITGGSVAYGNQAEHSIAAYLENELRIAYPDSAFQVINAGACLCSRAGVYYDTTRVAVLRTRHYCFDKRIQRFDKCRHKPILPLRRFAPTPPLEQLQGNRHQQWQTIAAGSFFRGIPKPCTPVRFRTTQDGRRKQVVCSIEPKLPKHSIGLCTTSTRYLRLLQSKKHQIHTLLATGKLVVVEQQQFFADAKSASSLQQYSASARHLLLRTQYNRITEFRKGRFS